MTAIAGISFLPTVVAALNRHHDATGTFLLDLLPGLSVLGRIAAPAWAVCRPARVARVRS